MAVLECRDLRKSYKNLVAVDGVSFRIEPGETYGLLGPNGAGKTTTVAMVCGLLERDGGDVEVAGRPMGPGSPAAKADVGYVPQEIALYPDLSGRENLEFFGQLYGMRKAALAERVTEALHIVGLSDRAGDRVATYSGGMQRRINIAAGLLHRPKLLVLDEPTVGVDPQSRNAILEQVERLSTEGMAVLYTTHYMEEAERLCDRVGIIDSGRIIAEGTRRELVDEIGSRDRIRITANGPVRKLLAAARRLKSVEEASEADGVVQLIVDQGAAVLPKLFEIAERNGVEVSGVEVIEPDLEAVFLHLTGKALRD